MQMQLVEREEALEKLENEARISNRKVQELQADMDSMDFEKFALTLLFQELSKNNPATNFDENITSFKQFGHLTPIVSHFLYNTITNSYHGTASVITFRKSSNNGKKPAHGTQLVCTPTQTRIHTHTQKHVHA